jgi:predicted RNase H-like HicB family nuclease
MVYELRIDVEELTDGSDYRYMATSPDLPGLIVAGDTAEEVLNLAPQVAAALITSTGSSSAPLRRQAEACRSGRPVCSG